MERNWGLLERDYIAALLERNFGIEWMKAKIADDGTPYRLQTVLACELGTQSAHGKGLAGLLETYKSIPDPRLKIQMAWHFTFDWPLDEPKVVARFLSADAPKELRVTLLQEWAKIPSGENSLDTAWMKELHERTGIGCVCLLRAIRWLWNGWHGLGRVVKTFGSQAIDDTRRGRAGLHQAKGNPRKTPRMRRFGRRLHDALNDGPDLIEMFGEGQMTRDELLDELRGKIPGSDAHSDALERAAWSQDGVGGGARRRRAVGCGVVPSERHG